MNTITRATVNDAELLAVIGKQTLLESHGHSAPKVDMDAYVNKNYSADFFQNELSNPANIYHIIYHNGQAAGYSKLILDYPHPAITLQHVTKLERIYLLKEFYELKMGRELFSFNIELSKSNKQAGMWLFVWKENPRAINLYLKNGFKIIGSHDFQISETHSNPNHIMLLEY
jgi:ribosomal protein S18 acetylase RimI-like enzyme